MLRAVLFDLDDTLLDHTGNQRQLTQLLRARHPAFAQQDVAWLAERSIAHLDELHPHIVAGRISPHDARVERFRRLLREAGADEADDADAKNLAHWHRQTYLEVESRIDGALELVADLHKRGLKLAIVSNSTRDEQTRKLATHGLAPYFDTLVLAGDHGILKPDPRLFAIALQELNVSADEAVMVGDSWSADVVGARAAGIRVVWFNRFEQLPADRSEIAQFSAFDGTAALERILS